MEVQAYQDHRPYPLPSAPTTLKDRRIAFAVFLKILLRCLEGIHQEATLRQSKLIVMACIREHEMGDPSCRPLEIAIEVRLRRIIDDTTWARAQTYSTYYLARKLSCRVAQVCAPLPPNPFLAAKKDSKQVSLEATSITEI